MPRWRVAGRRCSEYSETQRVRAEPLVRFRKIRFSWWKPCPGKSMAVPWAGPLPAVKSAKADWLVTELKESLAYRPL